MCSTSVKRLAPLRRNIGCHRLSLSSVATFKPPIIEEVRQEFRAYGNGSIDFQTIGNIGLIKLNYPERKNAISGRMMSDFYDIMTSIEARQGLKGLILTGEGDFFCAGGDLTTIQTHLTNSEMGWRMTCLMHETLKKFYTLPLLSVALVHGRALGGGAELTLAPDLRVFAETRGKLSFVQARMGLMPGWGGATRLKNLVGRSKSLEILLSCKTLNAVEATKLGLCDKTLPDSCDLLQETLDWMNDLTQHDVSVIGAIKKSVSSNYDEHSLEQERRLFAPLWAGPANKEALNRKIKH